jgi:hypothetical protein
MTDEPAPLFCDGCSTPLTPGRGDFYVVRIEAVADPTPPNLETRDAESLSAEIDRLFKRLGTFTEQEAVDQVFRRVVLYLCTTCYERWIEDPTGGQEPQAHR